MGVSIVVLTYDSKATLAKFIQKYNVSYTMLSDKDLTVIRQFGLLNTSYEPGTKYYGVPYPGIFFIDHQGVIRAKFAEENYRDRPLIDDLINAVSAPLIKVSSLTSD